MKSTNRERKGTKKHIAKVCLEVYEKLLEEGKKDNLERFKKRLEKQSCHYGICKLYNDKTGFNYKKMIKNVHFYSKPIYADGILSSDGILRFWFKVPYYAESKKEAIDLIKKRMEILKNW